MSFIVRLLKRDTHQHTYLHPSNTLCTIRSEMSISGRRVTATLRFQHLQLSPCTLSAGFCAAMTDDLEPVTLPEIILCPTADSTQHTNDRFDPSPGCIRLAINTSWEPGSISHGFYLLSWLNLPFLLLRQRASEGCAFPPPQSHAELRHTASAVHFLAIARRSIPFIGEYCVHYALPPPPPPPKLPRKPSCNPLDRLPARLLLLDGEHKGTVVCKMTHLKDMLKFVGTGWMKIVFERNPNVCLVEKKKNFDSKSKSTPPSYACRQTCEITIDFLTPQHSERVCG